MKTRPCDATTTRGRLKKAEEFYAAAEAVSDKPNAFVTMCVHAGIAAADVVCCAALAEHAQGDSHVEAVQLLQRVRPDGPELGRQLDLLLGVKTRAGYSADGVNADMVKRTRRAAEKLLQAARDRAG
jgi:hypothetical protein